MNRGSAHKLVIALTAFFAVGLLCVSGLEKVPRSGKTPFTESEKHAPFISVARVGGYVVAASSNGFYRTSLSTQDWRRISVPREMPAQGQFAVSEANSNVVYFCTSSHSPKGSLYISGDAGAKWKLLSKDYGFNFVHQNRDGRLYAIVWETVGGSIAAVHSRLIMSVDEGKTWKDISQNISGMLLNLFTDPKYPNRICVGTWAIRMGIFESPDDNYSKWIGSREWDWRADSKTDDDYLRGIGGYSSTIAYMLLANLQNYFDYDFGDSAQLPAFVIEVDTNNLQFSADQKVQVPIAIKFRPDYAPVKIVDATNNDEFWWIRCICPDGKHVVAGWTNRANQVSDSEKLKKRIGDGTGFQVFEISSTNSYRRIVSLDKLMDFSKPGEYRLTVSYDDNDWGWEGKKQSGIWGGGFSSPIFNLTINP